MTKDQIENKYNEIDINKTKESFSFPEEIKKKKPLSLFNREKMEKPNDK